MGVERFGDWDKAKRLLGGDLNQRLNLAIRAATIKNALLLVREIKRGIRDQAPGGKQFAPLAQVTIERKGSSKALIDTGFLLSSITQKIMSDGAFVGLLKTSVSEDGENVASIAAIMEYGCTINHPSGAVIVIPPRPFLHPTMEKYRDEVIDNYRQALASVFD
ncbi:MAG: phage virion morphogenesis protein [Armatimonadota bacterium]